MTAETSEKVCLGKILVLDDDPGFGRAVQRCLSHHGYSVVLHKDPRKADESALNEEFDLAVIDMMVGDRLVGLKIISSLRTNPRTTDMPIVAVTGYGPELLEAALKTGADASIEKLYFFERIMPLAGTLISRRSAAVPVVAHLEDDAGWAELVRSWLTTAGLAVRRVPDGPSLIDALASGLLSPDLVVMDLNLDGRDGLEVLAELKRRPQFQALPVLVHTAREDALLAACDLGALAVVPKEGTAGDHLVSAARAAIAQHEHSRGVIDAGDLRLDPRGGKVFLEKRLVAVLEARPFAILRELVLASPREVPDDALMATVATKRWNGPEATHARTLENYVADLKKSLGEGLADRIGRLRGAGFRYLA